MWGSGQKFSWQRFANSLVNHISKLQEAVGGWLQVRAPLFDLPVQPKTSCVDSVWCETSLNLISHIPETGVTVMVLTSWYWENPLKLVSMRVSAHSRWPQINTTSVLTPACIRLPQTTADGRQKLTSYDSVHWACFNRWLFLAVSCFLFRSFIREVSVF